MILVEKLYPRKGGLFSLWSDGEEIALLDRTLAERAGIREGTEVEEGELMRLSEETADKKAYELGVWLLSLRDYSKKVLTEKIAEKWGKRSAERAIEKLTEQNYLNDKRFAENMAETYLFDRNYSVFRTVYEMTQKGIDRHMAEEIVKALEPDETEIAGRVIEKKYKEKLLLPDGRRKVFAALSRLGFNSYDISRAIKNCLDGED